MIAHVLEMIANNLKRNVVELKEWYYLLQQLDELHPDIQRLIYQNFYNLVYKDIYYLLKDSALTEDLIQEVFFKVISIIHKHQIANPSAWIRQVARNHTMDYLRKNKKERYTKQLGDVSTLEIHFDDIDILYVDQEVETSIRDEVLHRSIAKLKPDYRELITLHYIEEMSYKEIATALDISEPAVGQKLLRARKKLLQIFKRKWVNRSE